MTKRKFEWDPKKNRANIMKHRVTFEEAETVFDDENAVYLFDESHSTDEERFHIIGEDRNFRELSVCHCYRGKDDDVIRIISARRATKIEIDYYYGRVEL
ncbi:MAG: BrnT family toxin [Oscillospiraceae bacterium]|nr:BrnT family toxin [Oscillospiraceae bacterium]